MKEEVLVAAAEEIRISEDRNRKRFDEKKLRELAESFKKVGQLHPGVCVRREDGGFEIVAGERRLRACQIAGIEFRFSLKEDVDELLLKEIELEENVCRVDLSWQEEVAAREALHRLREGQLARRGKKQTVRALAEELGVGKSLAQEDLELAKFAERYDEVREARSKSEAKKVVERIKKDFMRRLALEEAQERGGRTEVLEAGGEEAGGEETGEEVSARDRRIAEVGKRVILGDFEERIEGFKDGSFQIVFFDPPWGVGFDAVRKKGGGTKDYADAEVDFWKNLGRWLEILWRKMAEDSHLYMFFGIVNHGGVYNILERVGFETNRMPLVWWKQGAHSTRNPEKWPGRCYEPIAYGRKGKKPLVRLGAPDVIPTKAPWPSLKDIHPSAKHPDVYLDLLKRSAAPGDVILDPMCGSGMVAVAAETLIRTHALDWWMIEQDESFHALAIENVERGYFHLLNEPMKTVQVYIPPELPEDFREIEPGTDNWKRYWKAHPERQEEMLQWSLKRREEEAG